MRIALAAFTPGGAALLERLKPALVSSCGLDAARDFAVFDKNAESARAWAAREFKAADALVAVGAAGLTVRLIAPLVESKDKDPAVLVLDEAGRFVIPLLSGHIGGANRLARLLAAALGAQAVITTATDVNNIFAIDEWAAASGCAIGDIGKIKFISGALLAGREVGFCSDFSVQGTLPQGFALCARGRAASQAEGVSISLDEGKRPFAQTLSIIPRIAVLGAGCKKGTDAAQFERFVLARLAEAKVSPKALTALASIDLKAQEPCLLAFAAKYGLDFVTFSAPSLAAVPGDFASSSFVKERTGVGNVCERAAVAAGAERLVIGKLSEGGMTLALSLREWVCNF